MSVHDIYCSVYSIYILSKISLCLCMLFACPSKLSVVIYSICLLPILSVPLLVLVVDLSDLYYLSKVR
jgi:hypothetical protein